jgi:hypothetical protein
MIEAPKPAYEVSVCRIEYIEKMLHAPISLVLKLSCL